MTINQLLSKTFIFIFAFCIAHFAFLNHANAQEIYATNYNVQINIDKDRKANVIITIDLNNDQSSELAGGYSFVLPFPEIYDISTTLNSQPVGNSIKDESAVKSLEIDFGGQTIKPSSRSTLQIVFNATNAIRETAFATRDLYIPEIVPNHRVDNFALNITFDKSLGKPKFITAYNEEITENESSYSLNLLSQRGVFAIWADKIKLSGLSKISVFNSQAHTVNTLVNIIPFTGTQKVAYTKIAGGDKSIYDQFGNYFFQVELEPKSQKEIEYTFNLELDSNKTDYLEFLDYDTKVDEKTRIGGEILTQIAKSEQKIDQLYSVNNLLKQRIDADISSQTFLQDYKNDLWEKLSKDEKLTDSEFSLLSLSVANYLDLPSRINYGYLINDYFLNLDTSKPHTWVEVNVDDKTIIMDPYLERISGMEYFGIEKKLDRITMGTWHPEEKYNNVLGILEGDVQRRMDLKPLLDSKASTSSIGINFFLPENAKAGFNFSANLNITNNTLFALPVDKIFLNNTEYTNQLRINKTFLPLILPGQTYATEIKGIREDNFFNLGSKDYKIKVDFKNDSFRTVNTEGTINLELSTYTVIGIGFILLGIFIFGILVSVRRKMKRRWRGRRSRG